MFKVKNPGEMLRWISRNMNISNDETIVVGVTDDNGWAKVEYLSTGVAESQLGNAMSSVSEFRFDGFVVISGINEKLDKNQNLEKVEKYIDLYDMTATCLDVLRVDWENKTYTSDMCKYTDCCDPLNPRNMFKEEESILDYDDMDNIEEDDVVVDLPEEIKEELKRLFDSLSQ